MNKIIFIGAVFLTMFSTSCGNSKSKHEHKGIEYTSEYICPMHCDGSGSESEGNCPVCGMDYVKNEEISD